MSLSNSTIGSRRRAAAIASPSCVCAFSRARKASTCASKAYRSTIVGTASSSHVLSFTAFISTRSVRPDRCSDNAVRGTQLRKWLGLGSYHFVFRTENHPVQRAGARAGIGNSVVQTPVGIAYPNLRRVLPDLTVAMLDTWIVTHEICAACRASARCSIISWRRSNNTHKNHALRPFTIRNSGLGVGSAILTSVFTSRWRNGSARPRTVSIVSET